MNITFSQYPGHHERRLRRMHNNPLFAGAGVSVDAEAVATAAKQDSDDVDEFMTKLRELLQEAVDLPAEVDTDTLVALKERLEKAYSRCVSLAGDQSAVLQALKNLIGRMVDALRDAAGNDPIAEQNLDDEEIARSHFFALHDHVIVADLMRGDSAILPAELAPTLLSEDPAALDAALGLFSAEQLVSLSKQARTLVEELAGAGQDSSTVRHKLELIDRALLAPADESMPS
jgi:hypothetical protein